MVFLAGEVCLPLRFASARVTTSRRSSSSSLRCLTAFGRSLGRTCRPSCDEICFGAEGDGSLMPSVAKRSSRFAWWLGLVPWEDDAVKEAGKQILMALPPALKPPLRALHDNHIEIDSGTQSLPESACGPAHGYFRTFRQQRVPVVLAGSVLGVFELGERLTSQRAKDALSNWLLTFDVRKAGALPDGTQELFERVFGESHFSAKCFVRSTMFSVGAMIFIVLLGLLVLPHEFLGLINALDKPPSSSITLGVWLLLTLWVPWSILLDYLSLFKTRIILRVLTRLKRNVIYYIAVVAADLCIYKIMWSIGIVAVFVVYYFYASEDSTTVLELFAIGMDVLLDGFSIGLSFFPSFCSQGKSPTCFSCSSGLALRLPSGFGSTCPLCLSRVAFCEASGSLIGSDGSSMLKRTPFAQLAPLLLHWRLSHRLQLFSYLPKSPG